MRQSRRANRNDRVRSAPAWLSRVPTVIHTVPRMIFRLRYEAPYQSVGTLFAVVALKLAKLTLIKTICAEPW